MRDMYVGIKELYVFCNAGEPPVDFLNSVIVEFGGDPLCKVDPRGREYSYVARKKRRNVEVFGLASAGYEGKAVFRLIGNRNRHMLVPKGYRWCIDSFCHNYAGIHMWMFVAIPLVFMVRKPGSVIFIDSIPGDLRPLITSNPKVLWRLIERNYSAFASTLMREGLTHQDHPLLPRSLSIHQVERFPDGELFEDAVNQDLWEMV
jgi:hypothetical protein